MIEEYRTILGQRISQIENSLDSEEEDGQDIYEDEDEDEEEEEEEEEAEKDDETSHLLHN
jgi:hypothetical protein